MCSGELRKGSKKKFLPLWYLSVQLTPDKANSVSVLSKHFLAEQTFFLCPKVMLCTEFALFNTNSCYNKHIFNVAASSLYSPEYVIWIPHRVDFLWCNMLLFVVNIKFVRQGKRKNLLQITLTMDKTIHDIAYGIEVWHKLTF